MIAMLEIIPNERAALLKKLDYISPRKISAHLVSAGRVQLVSVRHRQHQRGINWKRLENITVANDWLLPKGITAPAKTALNVFTPQRLPAKLMENIAVNVLHNADIRPSALSLGLYPHKDSTITENVIERAREIRILCDEYNEEYAQDIMDRYGAAIICGSNEDIFENCQMVIAPHDNKGRAAAGQNALLFSPAPNQRRSLHVRTTLPQAPDVYSYPVRLFGALTVLSALYELESITELGLITPSLARLEDGLITADELSRYLRMLV